MERRPRLVRSIGHWPSYPAVHTSSVHKQFTLWEVTEPLMTHGAPWLVAPGGFPETRCSMVQSHGSASPRSHTPPSMRRKKKPFGQAQHRLATHWTRKPFPTQAFCPALLWKWPAWLLLETGRETLTLPACVSVTRGPSTITRSKETALARVTDPSEITVPGKSTVLSGM